MQEPGDVLITGPSTGHFVKALGNTYQSAWNIMPKNGIYLHAAYRRKLANENTTLPLPNGK